MRDTEDRANRAAFTKALRQLADAIDADPALTLPYQAANGLAVFVFDDLTRALAWRDLLPGAKTTHDTDRNFPARIDGHLHGLPVTVYVAASAALVDPTQVEAPNWPACDPRLGLDVAGRVAS